MFSLLYLFPKDSGRRLFWGRVEIKEGELKWRVQIGQEAALAGGYSGGGEILQQEQKCHEIKTGLTFESRLERSLFQGKKTLTQGLR